MKIKPEQIADYDLDVELTDGKVLFFDSKLQDGTQGYFMKGPIATFILYERSYNTWFWQGYAFYLAAKNLRVVPIIEWDEKKSEFQIDRCPPDDLHEHIWQFSNATSAIYDVNHELVTSIFTYFGVAEPDIDKMLRADDFESKMSNLMQKSLRHFADEVSATVDDE